jgi:hypothetical protein
MKHEVFPVLPTAINNAIGVTEQGVRLVFSFRYSIDGRDENLMNELLADDTKLASCGRRNDYVINKVVNAIEKGRLPEAVHKPSVPRGMPTVINIHTQQKVNPSAELITKGFCDDKPNSLKPDSITAGP